MTEGPKTYIKKPVGVEAWQFDGSTPSAHRIVAWIIENGANASVRDGYPDQGPDLITIGTLEGEMTAAPQDFVIRGVNGEFYPCKPDIFEKTYSKVEN